MAEQRDDLDSDNLKSIFSKEGDLFDKSDLNENVLPRNIDVLSYVKFLKSKCTTYHVKTDKHYAQKVNEYLEKNRYPYVIIHWY